MSESPIEKPGFRSNEFPNRFVREWELSKSDLVPPEFICPMTLDIMVDPVVIASGQTYERSYIERWFMDGHKTCPKTNQVLSHTNLCPNVAVRGVIQSWCKKNGIVLGKKTCPKGKVLVNDPHHGDEEKTKSGDIKKKIFSLFRGKDSSPRQEYASPRHETANVRRTIDDFRVTQLDIANLSAEFEAGSRLGQANKINSPAHRRQSSLPVSPVSIKEEGNADIIAEKLIVRSCRANRLNQFKQMMVSYSPANINCEESNISSPSTPSPKSSDSAADVQEAQNQMNFRKYHKSSLQAPYNLSLTKIPIQPAQNHSFVGLPNQRRSVISGRKLSTIHSPNADTLNKAAETVDCSAALPDWSADVDISGILAKLSSSSIEDARSAAEEMRGLSKASAATRMKIYEMGGISKLIPLLKSSDSATVEHSVTALLNLALEVKLKIEIVNSGALRPLASVLSDTKNSEKARENAAGALCSLSVAEENRDVICREGIVPLLVESLKNHKTIRGMKDATIGLFNLAISPSGRKLVVATGIVPYLISMLAEGNLQIEEEVMALLANLSKAEEACVTIEEEGGIALLVGVLEDGSIKSKLHAVSVLLQLVASDSARRNMWEEGVIPCLAGLSQLSINGRGKEKVSALLKILRETH